ncbi:MAG: ABC transporter substrate-binding protein [Blastochloris sp.]|nr:ABC transporter substrate-binding protein [Blastochloris sp.]
MPNTRISDALGRSLELAAVPQRIVSLVPSLTEWLFSVGGGDRVIGITDYCIEPAAQLRGLPRLGGTKNPRRAQIGELRPDLVIADQEENRERDVLALTAAAIPVYVTAIRSLADMASQLAALADLLGLQATAQLQAHAVRHVLAAALPGTRPIPTLALIWRDPWMLVGADTYAGDLLEHAGALNLGRRFAGRYPRAELATLMALQPEVILLPSEPYPFSPADRSAFAAYPAVPAVANNRILLCDGMALTWPGPRTPAALQSFRELLIK